ncbi:MAG: hypothetical protein H7836_17535 [Magnetococcus sp. YQC-3]
MYRLLRQIQSGVHQLCLSYVNNINWSSGSGWNGSLSNAVTYAFCFNGIYQSIGGAAFSVGAFDNSSPLSQVFDQYRLDKVVCEMTAANNASQVNNNVSFPNLYAVIDYDDASALTSASAAVAYSSCKYIQMGANTQNNGKQYFYLNRPTVQTSVQTTSLISTTAAARLAASPWLDMDNQNIEHNSMKFWMESPGGSSFTQYITMVFRVFVSLRSVR